MRRNSEWTLLVMMGACVYLFLIATITLRQATDKSVPCAPSQALVHDTLPVNCHADGFLAIGHESAFQNTRHGLVSPPPTVWTPLTGFPLPDRFGT
jgi:hypothetical protein